VLALRHAALLCLSSLALAGCVQTAFLPTQESQQYEPTHSVEVYWQSPPERSYLVIGQVSAMSSLSREKVFAKLKARAMKAGAHAILIGTSGVDMSVMGMPTSGGGTMIVPVRANSLEALAIRFTD